MTVQFEHEETIEAPIELVFDLSLDIDAHTASMARSKERAVGGVTAGPIGLGEEVTWRAWHFGIPFSMTSRVTELERPHRFVDELARGPFRWFRHEHVFNVQGTKTGMTDHVEFQAPVGAIGRVVERVLLERYLRQLIATRGTFLKHQAEAAVRDAESGGGLSAT